MKHDTNITDKSRGKSITQDTERTKAAYDEFEDSCLDQYDYLGKSASRGDQTGMIPSQPQSAAELESYQDLYPFAPPLLKSDRENIK